MSKSIRSHPTHGGYGTHLYEAWKNMKARCYNPNADNYSKYGGRGITVCDEWLHDFAAFRDWAMSHGYQDGLRIDRVNPDGPYSPGNCRWATRCPHGGYGTRLYKAWGNMKARCYRPSYLSYPNYGGRGITVCDEWRHDFAAFRDWSMSHGYQDGLFLDRIDFDGPYAPENCRWITQRQQISERNKKRARERRERIINQRNDYAPLPLRLLRYGSYGKED